MILHRKKVIARHLTGCDRSVTFQMLLTCNTSVEFVNGYLDLSDCFSRGDPMPTHCHEPTIQELLNDPLTRAVMKADSVDPQALRRMLGSVALEIERPDRQADYQPRSRYAPL